MVVDNAFVYRLDRPVGFISLQRGKRVVDALVFFSFILSRITVDLRLNDIYFLPFSACEFLDCQPTFELLENLMLSDHVATIEFLLDVSRQKVVHF